jgi:sterol desaturase/sphingolipid hydroxylase (fatty acid hydroxylase superfamily)
MTYWVWLAGLSALFIALERLWPRDARQRFARPGIVTDLFYMVFNGHWLGVALALLTEPLARALDAALAAQGVTLHLRVAAAWPWGVQLAVAFVAIDLIQWSIHNLLHRVPALWALHKVHHSIQHMDFWGSMRFHLGEVLVYRSLQYVPLALLGFDGRALFVIAVVSTAIGHLNHANLRVRMGWLRYVLNGPEMHIWHHAHPSAGPVNVNFGINLAVWDWLFGTAHLPRDGSVPRALGFEGIESFPRDPLRQELWGPWARSERVVDGRAVVADRPDVAGA